MKQRDRKLKIFLLPILVACVVAGILLFTYFRPFIHEKVKTTTEVAVTEEKKQNDTVSFNSEIPSVEVQNDMMSLEPITTQEVYPMDIYAVKDTEAVFQCYVPDATSYLWEYYDISTLSWVPAEENSIRQRRDELYRDSSFYTVRAIPENHEKMVRCTISFENREALVKMATIYVLEKEIADFSFDKTEYPSGSFLSIYEIPVTVNFTDGSQETITGLNELYFIYEDENTEYSTDSVSGNRVETITTIHTECKYLFLGAKERKTSMRYHMKDKVIDKEILFCGKDYEPPLISALDISDYVVSREDKAVPVTVTITAEDNETPFPYLEYAFLPKEQEITESDWQQKFAFEVSITQNGEWVAYCRDQSGNVSSEERKIITVDQKAPVITLKLAESDWSSSNKIVVDAVDELALQYLYRCPATGEESGWITYNEYEIFQNGTWSVQVRDAAGNVASAEIVVSNIDTQAPVINSIIEE